MREICVAFHRVLREMRRAEEEEWFWRILPIISFVIGLLLGIVEGFVLKAWR